jgi:glutamine cyclotransferase
MGKLMAKSMAKSGESERPGRRLPLWAWGVPAVIALALTAALFLGEQKPVKTAAPIAPVAAIAPAAAAPPAILERLKARVLATHPHDAECYTQGLLWDRGELYESCGLYGESSLRRTDPRTGAVRQSVAVPAQYFAEGLALVGERLLQLTWREGVAFVYDRKSLGKTGEIRYPGEGWGLCYDGKRLVMSDGSDRLTVRDPLTFAATGELKVNRDGVPVDRLNELECVGDSIYANVYETDEIVRIDAVTGRVTGSIDAAGLLNPDERQKAEVLNGIAWNPETKRFWITGKRWPKMFEVELVPAAALGEKPGEKPEKKP